MVCAGEEVAETAAPTTSGDDNIRSIGAPPSEEDGGSGATCGCDSCYAPAAPSLAVASLPGALPHQPSADPGIPPTVDRTPLVPPPQRLAW